MKIPNSYTIYEIKTCVLYSPTETVSIIPTNGNGCSDVQKFSAFRYFGLGPTFGEIKQGDESLDSVDAAVI